MEKVLKLNNKYFLLIWAFTLSYELKRISYHSRLVYLSRFQKPRELCEISEFNNVW